VHPLAKTGRDFTHRFEIGVHSNYLIALNAIANGQRAELPNLSSLFAGEEGIKFSVKLHLIDNLPAFGFGN